MPLGRFPTSTTPPDNGQTSEALAGRLSDTNKPTQWLTAWLMRLGRGQQQRQEGRPKAP